MFLEGIGHPRRGDVVFYRFEVLFAILKKLIFGLFCDFIKILEP